MQKKIRLDIYLAGEGISDSIEKAKREIISGWVKVNGETVRTPTKTITGKEEIKVSRPGGIYVSRGGEKLSHALNLFKVSVKDKVVLDLGSSTGGFTDCLLRGGAKLIYAVDVGYGQLDIRLRNDKRVIVMERTNVRNLSISKFNKKIDFLTADLSFISLLKVIPGIKKIFSPVEGILLVKPQFESVPGENKKGVVRERNYHKQILDRVIKSLISKGTIYYGLCYSAIKGPAGNIEFPFHCCIQSDTSKIIPFSDIRDDIHEIVDEAHMYFKL